MIIDINDQAFSTDLPFTYVFSPQDIEGILSCQLEHGFAVVKRMIPDQRVDQLKRAVESALLDGRPVKEGVTAIDYQFIEHAPSMAVLLEDESFMAIARALHGDELTLHRTAAIAKNAGAEMVDWHTDRTTNKMQIRDASTWMNTCSGCHAMWFYLTGSHPSRGGLAVLPDSHYEHWSGPDGFELNETMSSFKRPGSDTLRHDDMQVSGVLPLVTDPGDMILFAGRTYHAVFPNAGREIRLSCGIKFRPGQTSFPVPWARPESASRFIRAAPETAFPLVEHYTGYDPDWKNPTSGPSI